MATLVLSTVGTALGGPVGGAIGALIGQSIDQELLAPATRGPRVGDLSVQSSSYGTQIPRMYGTMRVAGSVVWATDLVESSETTGAKGQPDSTYSYSVSFAVALSSRPLSSIGRIWADGKLLRGAEGDFKVSTTFRFYEGAEDQTIDPLIGSVEGIANTPAYRGLALAVFENLELADYGNRIPFLTFEVVADAAAPSLSAILSDASGSAIACDAPQTIAGYAAYGRSIAAAVDPLVNCFGISLFDDGSVIRAPASIAPAPVDEGEFGNSADGQPVPKIEREQAASSSLPAVLRLSYYDPSRDYQTGEARAAAGEPAGTEAQQEMPAVLLAGDAKSLTQQMLARSWAQRDKLILRLPPARAGLEPGSIVALSLSPAEWIVESSTVDSFVAVVELRPSWSANAVIVADGGRSVANSDVVAAAATLALLDIPNVTGEVASEPLILLAASSPTPGWSARSVSIAIPGQALVNQTTRRKSMLGSADSVLGFAEAALMDLVNTVDIELIDQEQWLTSCDDRALSDGLNLAVLGDELIQFGNAALLGPGRFRLSRLLRGRGGTEWASSSHAAGETFCLIERDGLQAVALPAWCTGSIVTASAAKASNWSVSVSAESLRPPNPVNAAAELLPSGEVLLSWTRRSRSGFAWIDEIDAPLGEASEQYRVNVSGAAGSIELACQEAALTIDAATIAQCGAGTASIEIRQIGDGAVSRPTQLNIILP